MVEDKRSDELKELSRLLDFIKEIQEGKWKEELNQLGDNISVGDAYQTLKAQGKIRR